MPDRTHLQMIAIVLATMFTSGWLSAGQTMPPATGASAPAESDDAQRQALVEEFFRAVRLMNRQKVERMLQETPDLVHETNGDGQTALHQSARISDQQMLDLLLVNDARPDARDSQGRTALHFAAQAHDPDPVKSLLLAGADINALDDQARTPLDYATSEPVRALLVKQGGLSYQQIGSDLETAVRQTLPASMQFLVTQEYFGIRLWRLIAALLILLLAFIANTVIRWYILKRRKQAQALAEAERKPQSFAGMTLRATLLPLRIVIWAAAVRLLGPVLMPSLVHGAIWLSEVLLSIALAVFLYQFVEVIECYLLRYAERTDTKLDDMLVPVLRKTLRALVVILAGLHLYQSITDQPVTTILAGLGLGGLAFALAAQDTLKNLFGFLMIALDRPFVMGDRIVFDDHDGIVESMGLRSTRVRRLDGHVVTIPNSRAADSVVHNIGRRPYIRRILNVTVTYDTSPDKVERAVAILREIFDNHEGMDPEFPPRVYFSEFNADSLNIIVIYWYHPPAYWDFMEHCQKTNMQILRRFNDEGIDFAFPTQTLYLAGDPARKLTLHHEGLDGLTRGADMPPPER